MCNANIGFLKANAKKISLIVNTAGNVFRCHGNVMVLLIVNKEKTKKISHAVSF